MIHGKSSTYTNHACRCPKCTTAQAQWQAEYRRRKREGAAVLRRGPVPAGKHGNSAYTNYACRCEVCTAASTATRRAWAERKRS